MRTPLRPLPREAAVWAGRVRRLRWLDALAAGVMAWAVAAWLWPATDATALGVLVAMFLPLAAAIPPLRRRWRPVSATVGLALSWPLRAGDRAWHIDPDGRIRLVLVTAPRWRGVVVAGVIQDSGEGAVVSRMRGMLVPVKSAGG